MSAWKTTLAPRAHARWLLASSTCSILAMAGMIVSVPAIDRHPVSFALSLGWVIGGFVPLFTRDWFLRMDPWRFRFAPWENEGRIWRYAGVEIFRWLLRHTPVGWLNPALTLTASKAGMEALLRQMNFAEGAHLVGGVITLGLAIGSLATGHRDAGITFAAITLLFHFYPLITQRWNRGRMARMMRRWALEDGPGRGQ